MSDGPFWFQLDHPNYQKKDTRSPGDAFCWVGAYMVSTRFFLLPAFTSYSSL